MKKFLKTKGTKIVKEDKPIILGGVNLGGWLMMEAYILYAPNRAERFFKENFAKSLGQEALREFEDGFRNNFIREDDFKNIARLGLNCIRLPFNCRLVEAAPYKYSEEGLKVLDRALNWAAQNEIYVILDLHAAPGAQNHDWHSDSLGQAELWQNAEYQKRTYALWEFLADRYKEKEYVAGYDLLNEAVLGDNALLNRFYKEVIKAIRRSDKNHILFIEGNRWAQDLGVLDKFNDDNYVLSIHNYEPLEFSFNFITGINYPFKTPKGSWNKTLMYEHLLKSKKIADEHDVPVFVGEFGVNARDGFYGEDIWLKDTLSCYKKLGFHWTYWTYKAIKNFVHPDGLYSYAPNPVWVNRPGPLMGWETYHLHWTTSKHDMIESWKTKHFAPNQALLKVLKDAK